MKKTVPKHCTLALPEVALGLVIVALASFIVLFVNHNAHKANQTLYSASKIATSSSIAPAKTEPASDSAIAAAAAAANPNNQQATQDLTDASSTLIAY